jgi:hypothetical protein
MPSPGHFTPRGAGLPEVHPILGGTDHRISCLAGERRGELRQVGQGSKDSVLGGRVLVRSRAAGPPPGARNATSPHSAAPNVIVGGRDSVGSGADMSADCRDTGIGKTAIGGIGESGPERSGQRGIGSARAKKMKAAYGSYQAVEPRSGHAAVVGRKSDALTS